MRSSSSSPALEWSCESWRSEWPERRKHGSGMLLKGVVAILFAPLLFLPGGCRQDAQAAAAERIPEIRVRLYASQDRVMVTASHPPTVSVGGSQRRLNFPTGE